MVWVLTENSESDIDFEDELSEVGGCAWLA